MYKNRRRTIPMHAIEFNRTPIPLAAHTARHTAGVVDLVEKSKVTQTAHLPNTGRERSDQSE
jgi:hypothetical protein